MVTPSEIRVRRVNHRGHVIEWTLNPLWVRLDRGGPEFGIERLSWSPAAAASPSATF